MWIVWFVSTTVTILSHRMHCTFSNVWYVRSHPKCAQWTTRKATTTKQQKWSERKKNNINRKLNGFFRLFCSLSHVGCRYVFFLVYNIASHPSSGLHTVISNCHMKGRETKKYKTQVYASTLIPKWNETNEEQNNEHIWADRVESSQRRRCWNIKAKNDRENCINT